MVRERVRSLGRALRQQPYEAALSVAWLSGLVPMVTGRGSAAVARVLPSWSFHILGGVIALGGMLTLAGLVLAGLSVDDVRRVVARRLEQSGQIMISGVLMVIGAGAVSFGAAGAVTGGVYLALAAATVTRAVVIAETFRVAGRLQ